MAPRIICQSNKSKPARDDSSWTLLQKGKFVKMALDLQPDIVTFTVLSDEFDSRLLEQSLQALLDKYPILRGRAAKNRKGDECWVQEAYFPNEASHYLKILDLTKTTTNDDDDDDDDDDNNNTGIPPFASVHHQTVGNDQEIFDYLDHHVAPRCDSLLNVRQRIRECLPHFGIQVILLPTSSSAPSLKTTSSSSSGGQSSYYCVRVMISHLLADGTTYYQLLHELMELWKYNRSVDYTLRWGQNTEFVTKELAVNPRDVATLTGLPTAFGFLRGAFRYGFDVKKRFRTLYIDKAKVETKKMELKEPDVEFLSTNDVLTGFLCQAVPSCRMVRIARNDRDMATAERYDAGNFFSELPIPNLTNPNQVRRAVNQGYHYPPGKIPRRPLYQGRQVMMTSWATAQTEPLVPEYCIAHTPDPSFLRCLPCTEIIVANWNKDTLLVMHTLPRHLSKEGVDLLQSISVSAR